MTPLHKLAVMAVNKLLECKVITLEAPDENATTPKEKGHLFTDLAGKPTVINWNSIGQGELRISVWWDYDHSKHPQAYPDLPDSSPNKETFNTGKPLAKKHHYPKFVGVTLSFWFERKTGKWIQCQNGVFKGFDRYIRRDMTEELKKLPSVVPNGFKASGRYFN